MRHPTARALVRLVALMTLAGCGGSAPVDPCVPPCLHAIEDRCLPAGTCVGDMTSINFCYGNGVKDLTTIDPASDVATTVRTTTDGVTACFYEILAPEVDMSGVSTGSGTLTWEDASGRVVATATFGTTVDTVITCQDTGTMYACPHGMPFDVPVPACTDYSGCQ